jgi:hypothetical protein
MEGIMSQPQVDEEMENLKTAEYPAVLKEGLTCNCADEEIWEDIDLSDLEEME